MKHTMKMEKVLVVLSPDLIRPDEPEQSPLIQRAVSLAKITGCELELFHVCYDGGLELNLFESYADLKRHREELIDQDATLLAEMATRLKKGNINVRYDARWDSPRTDAILRKIAQAKPDIVMKQAREHSFILGITSNTDWDLARRSPAHVWLVNDKVEDIHRIMAAIGNSFGDPGDITTAADFDLLRMTGLLGDTFKAAIYPVNAYQVPYTQNPMASIDGTAAPTDSVEEQKHLRLQTVKQHSSSVEALAQYFNIAKDNVHIREGHPNEVIPDVAEFIGADMIVMGAHSIGRLERLVRSVTVEPVIADTNTDILIIRERDLVHVPDSAESPLYGHPKYDLESAFTNPAATFDSPNVIANLTDISIDLRKRILQTWEYDIRAAMAEENEGGPTRDMDINALHEIFSARALLKTEQIKDGNGHMELHSVSR